MKRPLSSSIWQRITNKIRYGRFLFLRVLNHCIDGYRNFGYSTFHYGELYMRALRVFSLMGLVSLTFIIAGCSAGNPTQPDLAQPAQAPVIIDTQVQATQAIATEIPATSVPPTEIQPTTAPAIAGLTADQKTQAQQVLNSACAACHSTDRITRARGDLAGWQQVIQQMRDRGAQMTDDQAALLAQYLAETYPQ
jgi:cytochrome c5